MRRNTAHVAWAGAVLLALAVVAPWSLSGIAAPVLGLVGSGWWSGLGCIVCAGAGIAAAFSGLGLATLLWSQAAFSGAMACIGICSAALG